MDFIDRMLPEAGRRFLVRLVHAVCAAVMFFLTWQVWIKAGKIAGYGDTTDVLKITVGPFVYFMAVMILLTGLVHVYKMFVPGEAHASQGTT
jgi:TRAP-type C4-dicarboxylate transport system permease small subunit